jgi:hypothetical protein
MWEAACRGFDLPDFILPMPSRIIAVAVLQAPMLLPHAATTAMEVLIGILLSLMVAVPLAMIMFAHPAVENAIAPFLVASQAVPVFPGGAGICNCTFAGNLAGIWNSQQGADGGRHYFFSDHSELTGRV